MSAVDKRQNVKYHMINPHNEIMSDEYKNEDISIDMENLDSTQSRKSESLLSNDCYTNSYNRYKCFSIAVGRAWMTIFFLAIGVGFVFLLKYLIRCDFNKQNSIGPIMGYFLIIIVIGCVCAYGGGAICYAIGISIQCCCGNEDEQDHYHDEWKRMNLKQRFDYILSNWIRSSGLKHEYPGINKFALCVDVESEMYKFAEKVLEHVCEKSCYVGLDHHI